MHISESVIYTCAGHIAYVHTSCDIYVFLSIDVFVSARKCERASELGGGGRGGLSQCGRGGCTSEGALARPPSVQRICWYAESIISIQYSE